MEDFYAALAVLLIIFRRIPDLVLEILENRDRKRRNCSFRRDTTWFCALAHPFFIERGVRTII